MEIIFQGEKQSSPIHSQKLGTAFTADAQILHQRPGQEEGGKYELRCHNLAEAEETECDRTFVFFSSEHLGDNTVTSAPILN